MKKLPAQPVGGLIDGLAVINELAVAKEPLSCIVLSEKLGIEKTRMNRLLKTLDYLGLADRAKGRKYRIGPGMHILSVQSMLGSGLIAKSLPALEDLRRHGLTVALGTLWRDTVSYLYHGGPDISPFESIGRLSLYPATKSSVGMVLLSEKDDDEISALFEGKDIPSYGNDFVSLLKDLQSIKNNGFSAVQTAENIFSIAVNLGSPSYAAIALSGNMKKEEIQKYLSILKKAAQKIEEDSNEDKKA